MTPDVSSSAAALKSSAGQRGAMMKRKDEEAEVQDLIFSLETHSSKELRHFKFLCVSFMAQLLNSNAFIAKVREFILNNIIKIDQWVPEKRLKSPFPPK